MSEQASEGHDHTGPLPRIPRDAADIRRRGEKVLDEVGARSRADLGARVARLRIAAPLIAQSAIAAGLAWWIAGHFAADDAPPFFAPVAAVISLGSALGLRVRRTAELVVGVAVGLLVADLLLAVIGTGTWQLVLVVGLAMAAAVALDGGQLLVLQAATSSVLVATLVPADGLTQGVDRFRDALIGGFVGMAVGMLLLPLNPLTVAKRSTAPVIDGLTTGLASIADSLAANDYDASLAALHKLRALDPLVAQMTAAVGTAEEVAHMAPVRWGARDRSELYSEAAVHLDYAHRNIRVLARRAQVLQHAHHECPPDLAVAVRSLADAVRGVAGMLDGSTDARTPRDTLLSAYALARGTMGPGSPETVVALIAQHRSIVYDLLRATGLGRLDALALLEG
ncbi:MAG: FUSC family protein [Sporichthyaceae bacterium]